VTSPGIGFGGEPIRSCVTYLSFRDNRKIEFWPQYKIKMGACQRRYAQCIAIVVIDEEWPQPVTAELVLTKDQP